MNVVVVAPATAVAGAATTTPAKWITPLYGAHLPAKKARGPLVFPILGNRHPRPFGKIYCRTGGPLRAT
jgi:hypothetical protein